MEWREREREGVTYPRDLSLSESHPLSGCVVETTWKPVVAGWMVEGGFEGMERGRECVGEPEGVRWTVRRGAERSREGEGEREGFQEDPWTP